MQLLKIRESGANNILMWAISNGADIKNDPALQSIINDELSYLMTIDNVNFFELFRLTQIYRDSIRIVDENKAEMPTRRELHEIFKGTYKVDPEDPSKDVQLCEIVEHCGDMFINLAMQMTNDDHIITSNAVRMFLPMISRKFAIQIPISFADVINSISVDEANQIYNTNYPETLDTIIESETHGMKTSLQLALLRNTSIIKYNKQYEQYLKIIKYAPLKTCDNSKIYKIGMLGFFKYDNVSRSNIRIDLFNINKNTMESALKRIAHINNPLQVEFAIQLPIQYMQMLENFFSDEVLTIAYESSMSNIIDGGLKYENFITSEYDDTDENKVEEYNNSLESYRLRITEANQTMLNSIPIILNSDGDVDVNNVFALLPSIYTTKAVVRINTDNFNKLSNHYDPIIKEMFNDIINITNSIIEDINRTK